MKHTYTTPQITVARWTAAAVTTVSTDVSWDEKWSDVLAEEDDA